MRFSKFVLLLFLSVNSFTTNSFAAEVNFSGYIKSYGMVLEEIDTPIFETPTTYQSQNAARFMVDVFTDNAVWQVHYEILPTFTSHELLADFGLGRTRSEGYRFSDLQNELIENDRERSVIYQNLDRLNVQFQFEAGDLTIGRQAIGFGAARSVNPSDIFLPLDIRTLDSEYTHGVDAVRFQAPVGDLSDIDAGVVLGQDAKKENSAAYLKYTTNRSGTDYSVMLMQFSEQDLFSASFQTTIGDFGFWMEAAVVNGDEDYTRLTTGLDYGIDEHTLIVMEYHHNGAGRDDPEDYSGLFNTTPYQKGGVYLLGEDYLLAFINRQISPLLSLNGAVFYNFSDESMFAQVNGEYSITEDLFVDFGYYNFSGDDAEVDNFGLPRFGSEYGTNPNIVYAALRYYF